MNSHESQVASNVINLPRRYVAAMRITPWMILSASPYWLACHQIRHCREIDPRRPLRPGIVSLKADEAVLKTTMRWLKSSPLAGRVEVLGTYQCTVWGLHTDRVITSLSLRFLDRRDAFFWWSWRGEDGAPRH